MLVETKIMLLYAIDLLVLKNNKRKIPLSLWEIGLFLYILVYKHIFWLYVNKMYGLLNQFFPNRLTMPIFKSTCKIHVMFDAIKLTMCTINDCNLFAFDIRNVCTLKIYKIELRIKFPFEGNFFDILFLP